jgi:signal peptidase II
LRKSFLIVLLVLALDQTSKFWVKTNMVLGEEFSVLGNWFLIHFTENNGMAFGMELAGPMGKLLLSLFRLFAIAALGYGLFWINKKKFHPGFIICVALVFAGALGNLIDSLFYGRIFSDSFGRVASIFPENDGYAPIFYGRVVDMLYFPLIQGTFPSWLPIWGGEEFLFFRPVFNIADASITSGMAIFLLFQKRFFPENKINKQNDLQGDGTETSKKS